jgi:hypothetical protein
MARDYGFGTLTEEQGKNSLIGLGIYTEEETQGKSFTELYRKYEKGLKDPESYGTLSTQLAGTRGKGTSNYRWSRMSHTNSNDAEKTTAGDIREDDWDSRARESKYRVFGSMKALYDSLGGPLASTSEEEGDGGEGEGDSGQVDYAELMRLQEEAALRASSFNRQLASDLSGEVGAQTIDTAKALDEALRSEMDKLYPGMRESTAAYSQDALNATRKAAAEFSTGNVPQDVQDYQKRLAASLGISRGVFGTAPNYALAQNLGLTSLDMKKYGTQLYGTIPTMSSQVLANARTSMPAMNQLPQMYDSAYARAFAASAMPTGAFMGSIAQAMGQNASMAQNQSQFETSLAWSQQLSAMQMAAEAERNRIQMDYYNRALNVEKRGQTLGLLGKALGFGGGMFGGGKTDKTDGTTGNRNNVGGSTQASNGYDYSGYYWDTSGGSAGRQYYDYGNYYNYPSGYGSYGDYGDSGYGWDTAPSSSGSGLQETEYAYA